MRLVAEREISGKTSLTRFGSRLYCPPFPEFHFRLMKSVHKLTVLKPPAGGPAIADVTSAITRRRRVLLAIGLVGVVALSNVRLPVRTFRQLAEQPAGGQTEDFLARCRRLESLMPTGDRIGYVALVGKQPEAVKDAQQRLLQYAFAPRRIEPFSGHELVIVQADEKAPALALAKDRGWQIVADAGGELLAFRTESALSPRVEER